jgi:hypothetical protein
MYGQYLKDFDRTSAICTYILMTFQTADRKFLTSYPASKLPMPDQFVLRLALVLQPFQASLK